jgi:triosephosphate isomerase
MKKIVIANWKMKLNFKESLELAKKYQIKLGELNQGEIVVCPPSFALTSVKKIFHGSSIKLGSQNVFWEEKGAYTGELSASMLREIGCEYVIIGHSERRQYLLENYEMIHKKIKAVLNIDGVTPIVCVGENWEERKTDRRDYVLVEQLHQALSGLDIIGDQQVIIAYEPIWAIGTGTAIEPSEAAYAHKIIKLALGDVFDSRTVDSNFRIVYGGSISSKIVKDFVNLENIDGLLVGGASLDVAEFYKVAKTILAK